MMLMEQKDNGLKIEEEKGPSSFGSLHSHEITLKEGEPWYCFWVTSSIKPTVELFH